MVRKGALRVWKWVRPLVIILAIYGAVRLVQDGRRLWKEHKALAEHAAELRPYKDSLYRGLSKNDFSYPFAAKEDLEVLRKEFSFLEEAPTRREKVVRLIAWIDQNMARREVLSIRGVDLLRERSAACEVHGLAISVLKAFNVKSRWISNAKSSSGFGFLEAFVEGGWELFRIRSGKEDPGLGMSALALYEESEPNLCIRHFYAKPEQSVRSWMGSVYPGLFPLGNVQDHPELRKIFTSAEGLELSYDEFNPYDYIYGYFWKADADWTNNDSLLQNFRAHMASPGMQAARAQADRINRTNAGSSILE